jgi:hypothetical protein
MAAGLIDDMVRPSVGVGRDSSACRLVGRSLPHVLEKIVLRPICQVLRHISSLEIEFVANAVRPELTLLRMN